MQPKTRSACLAVSRALEGASGSLLPFMGMDASASLILARGIPPYTFSITNDDPSTVLDFEGNLWRTKANEVAFRGARRCHNLMAKTHQFDDWAYYGDGFYSESAGVMTITGLTGASAANRVDHANTDVEGVAVAGKRFIYSFLAKALTGEGGNVLRLRIRASAGTAGTINHDLIIPSDSEFTRIAVNTDGDSWDATSTGLRIDFNGLSTSSTGVILKEPMWEEVTGRNAANWADVDAPSEFVSAGAGDDHGTNVDDVEYFDYECGNTVDANGVVTEAQGAAIAAATLRGVQCYGSRQNLEPYSNDIAASSFALTQCQLGTAKIGWHTNGSSGKGAEKLEPLDTTAQARHFAYSVTQTLDQPYCFYVVVEAAGEEWVRVYNTAKTAGTARAWFHIPAGGGGSVGTLQTGVDDAGIVYLGQDRYLCWMTVTGSGALGTHGVGMSDADNTTTYTPSLVTDGIYVHAVQHTTGQLPMPYVPTTGTTVTDEYSLLHYPKANYSETCTIYAKFYVTETDIGTGSGRVIFSIQDSNSSNDYVVGQLVGANGKFQATVRVGASNVTASIQTVLVEGFNEVALSIGGGVIDNIISVNGATVAAAVPSSASPAYTDIDAIYIGSNELSAHLNGSVTDFQIFRGRQTQARINELTT